MVRSIARAVALRTSGSSSTGLSAFGSAPHQRTLVARVVMAWLPWLALFLGVGLRVREYLADRSLWIDELMLALGVNHRAVTDLLRPLDFNQAAPAGFLVLVKSSTALFGNSELGLRLVPFLSSVC